MDELFRKKPVVIAAIRFTGGRDNTREVRDFCRRHSSIEGETFIVKSSATTQAWNYVKDDKWGEEIVAAVYDELHETWVGVKRGQWIIRGVKGELYPCDHSTFIETYDPLEAG